MKRIAILILAGALLLLPACSKPNLRETPEVSQPHTVPEEPIVPEEPLTPEEPIVPEEPLVPEEPFVPEEPAVPEEPPALLARYVAVKVNGLNVRTGAGTKYPSLGQAEAGTLLQLCEERDGWYRTFYRGEPAYVSADARYTEPFALPAGSEAAERVIEAGLQLLGTPYVYGAVRYHDGNGNKLDRFTRARFDCSSLMQYIFYEGAEVLLGVTTRTQVLQGTHVAYEALERGDLMFFTNAARAQKTGIERVGHVALWLGEGYILHTASDYAKVEKLSSARRAYFLEARRFL